VNGVRAERVDAFHGAEMSFFYGFQQVFGVP